MFSTQVCFMPSLTENGQIVLQQKNFLKFFNHLTFIPYGEFLDPSFAQTEIPFNQRCFRPSLVELVQSFWRRSQKYEKLADIWTYRQTDRQTDGRQLIRRFQRRRGVNRYHINNKIKHICHLCKGLT